MKKVEIKKLARIEAPAGEYENITAFQMVEYTIDFFGNIISGTLDTKITNDGRQIVIDGDGYIPAGYEIA